MHGSSKNLAKEEVKVTHQALGMTKLTTHAVHISAKDNKTKESHDVSDNRFGPRGGDRSLEETAPLKA